MFFRSHCLRVQFELRALTWADLDFENDTIEIIKTEYKRTIQTPKTPSSIRNIHIPRHVMSLLERFKAIQKPKASHAVFSRDVDRISQTHLTKIFNQYIKKTAVKKIRLHDVRHSHACYLINKGMIISTWSQ
ncbi:tyrosine-type recombinase/integrase [Sporosarcina sp. NCCP-2716]|uniref:tyrosine-type recombinase/integrase n=1 Tax=Sporosarcina sp. NCCP-2716 TaxID=2943679 RepID=UPI0037D9DEEA